MYKYEIDYFVQRTNDDGDIHDDVVDDDDGNDYDDDGCTLLYTIWKQHKMEINKTKIDNVGISLHRFCVKFFCFCACSRK